MLFLLPLYPCSMHKISYFTLLTSYFFCSILLPERPWPPGHDGRDKGVALEIGIQCYLGDEGQTLLWPLATVHDGRDKGVALEIGFKCYLGDHGQTLLQALPARLGKAYLKLKKRPLLIRLILRFFLCHQPEIGRY